jgi:hypothetical protein
METCFPRLENTPPRAVGEDRNMCTWYRVVPRWVAPLRSPMVPLGLATGDQSCQEDAGAGDGTFQFATDPRGASIGPLFQIVPAD